jgi:DNA-binding transcriptional MocR family regulator
MWIPDLSKYKGFRYAALADALCDDIRFGKLSPGTRLPPMRELADVLGVTLGTVTRAYAQA